MAAPASVLRLRAAAPAYPGLGLCTSYAYTRPRLASLASPLCTPRWASTLYDAKTPVPAVLDASTANPPPTTRPPPLALPARTPDTSLPAHLFATGKAFLAFYKQGIKNHFANRRLVRALDPAAPPTRASLVLQQRYAHDRRRLPLFGVMLLVLGELTPLVILLFPNVVPSTCRFPRQVRAVRERDQIRRERAFAADLDDTQRMMRVLPLGRTLLFERWPLPLVTAHGLAAHLDFLAADDRLLRAAGGADALVADEVVLACEDRGLDVVERPVEDLRTLLRRWLAVSTSGGDSPHALLVQMLTRRPDAWPSSDSSDLSDSDSS